MKHDRLDGRNGSKGREGRDGRASRRRPPPRRSFIDRYFVPLTTGIAVFGVLAVALVWFWPTGGASGAAAQDLDLPSYPVEQVARGRDAYAANCAVCHGTEGQGNPAAGIPALDGSMHAWHHPDSQITGFLRNGLGAMPAVGAGWRDEDVGAVLAYVKQWWEPEQLAHQTRASRQNP